MSSRLRSSSVGSKPRPRIHRPSRAESAQALALDVRCACQFFETKSLLPERVNPVGYNTAEEFEPCLHVNARIRDRSEIEQQTDTNMAFKTPNSQFQPMNVQPIQLENGASTSQSSNICELPPEFAPETMFNDNIENQEPTFGNRSASLANMTGRPPTPQFMKQRDPSTSSLLRKRMSEERQGFSILNKRTSQSTNNRDQFITQKDPSESAILRRKMSNRSSGSFDRIQLFHQSRIPNERTFYHDSNDMIRNSNVGINMSKMEFDTSPTIQSQFQKAEIVAPLTLQAQGNRRSLLSSTENLPQKSSVETEPDSGIDSNFSDPPRKTDIEKLQHHRNVSDEEKVQILLSKTQHFNDSVVEPQPKPTPRHKPKMQLMQAEDVKSVDMIQPIQSKLQYQYMAKYDDTTRPQEAETNEYSQSKLFDNYKGSQVQLSTAAPSNVSTPELSLNYMQQRDPSRSTFTQNRYNEAHTPTTPTMETLSPMSPMSMSLKTNQDKLLPSAGEFPERRASEVSPYEQNQQPTGPNFIRQKDLKSSNVLNRRRRNLSQTSLGKEAMATADVTSQPTKVIKTLSFEKSLAQTESDHISPYTGTNVKIVKGVSFECNRPLPADRHERNTFDLLHPSTNRRSFR